MKERLKIIFKIGVAFFIATNTEGMRCEWPGFAGIVKLLKSINQRQMCVSRSDVKVAKRKTLLFLK